MNILNFFIKTAYAHSEIDVNSYGHHMLDWNMWGMGGGILMIIFWVALVGALIWVLRGTFGGGEGEKRSSQNALGILKERYAKGEITEEEFTKMKKELQR